MLHIEDDIFDPILLARQTAIEQRQAAMLALDNQGRVITLSRQPRHLVPWLRAIVTRHPSANAWNYRAFGPTARIAPSPPGRTMIDNCVVI